MGKVTTYMNVYQNFEILGNKDGFDVTNYLKKNGYSFGSGEINTGGKHGDRARLILKLRQQEMQYPS